MGSFSWVLVICQMRGAMLTIIVVINSVLVAIISAN